MSILGRIAKGIGAAALTNNLGAGLVAAGTDSFTLGAATGVASNLMNPYGMMGNLSMYNNMYNNNMYNNFGGVNMMTMGNLNMYGGYPTMSPFGMGMGMGMYTTPYPMNFGMWY